MNTRSRRNVRFLLVLGIGWFLSGCSSDDRSVDPIEHLLNSRDSLSRFPPPDTLIPSLQIDDIGDAALTPDGQHVLVAHKSSLISREAATLYHLTTGEKIRTFRPYQFLIQRFASMAISSDGTQLAIAGMYGTSGLAYPGFMIWDIESGNIRQRSLDLPLSKLPTVLAFAPGDSVLIGGYTDGRLIAFKTSPKRIPPHFIPEIDSAHFSGTIYEAITSLRFSPSGHYILSTPPVVWSYPSRSLAEDFDKIKKWNGDAISYRRDDLHFVMGAGNNIYFYSTARTEPEHHIRTDTDDNMIIRAITISEDDSLIVTGDNLGNVRVWKNPSGKPLYVGFTNLSIRTIQYAPDFRSFISVARENEYRAGAVCYWKLPE